MRRRTGRSGDLAEDAWNRSWEVQPQDPMLIDGRLRPDIDRSTRRRRTGPGVSKSNAGDHHGWIMDRSIPDVLVSRACPGYGHGPGRMEGSPGMHLAVGALSRRMPNAVDSPHPLG